MTIKLKDYSFENLQEEYCIRYFKVYNTFPSQDKRRSMNKNDLINEIFELEETAIYEMQSSIANA